MSKYSNNIHPSKSCILDRGAGAIFRDIRDVTTVRREGEVVCRDSLTNRIFDVQLSYVRGVCSVSTELEQSRDPPLR